MNRQTLTNSLLVALVVALLLGINLLFYVKPEPDAEMDDYYADRSTHSGRPYGTLGAYLLLQESGVRVSRWEQDYRALADRQDVRVVILVEPRTKPTTRQLRALAEWIGRGGTFVMFERSWPLRLGRQQLLPGSYLPPEGPGSAFSQVPVQRAVPWQPGGAFQGVSWLGVSPKATTVMMQPAPISDTGDDSPFPFQMAACVPLAGVQDTPAVAEVRYGEGRIIHVGDPFVIANQGLAEGDNARFLLNLVRLATRDNAGQVVFDDYHHGYRTTNGGLLGLLGYFRGTPIPWMVWHIVALGLLAAYTLGRRFGRPVRLPVKPRTNALEFVTAMAQIQKAAAARDLALENLYRRFHRRLCHYTGLPTTAPLKELCLAASERSGHPMSEWRAVTERCQAVIEERAAMSDAELLRLAQRLRALDARLPP
ncbi:DUF4350 domain-containing protein [Chloracidobacterium thermophilum]|uniref:DUF4350 domain-containing protein n=1 Tax=Chloracidobacterium thermophilum TaxID=458033 RepID=UPI000738B5D0|nr:DUF4350 domain-containing protein [Chloracidobacterium thermophilum]